MTDKIKIGENEYQPPFRELDDEEIDEVWVMDANNNYVKVESVIAALNELAQLRAERDGLKARVETRDALINVMAPMHQLTCRNHKSCPICKAYDKYSKEIDGEPVNTTPGGDE